MQVKFKSGEVGRSGRQTPTDLSTVQLELHQGVGDSLPELLLHPALCDLWKTGFPAKIPTQQVNSDTVDMSYSRARVIFWGAGWGLVRRRNSAAAATRCRLRTRHPICGSDNEKERKSHPTLVRECLIIWLECWILRVVRSAKLWLQNCFQFQAGQDLLRVELVELVGIVCGIISFKILLLNCLPHDFLNEMQM